MTTTNHVRGLRNTISLRQMAKQIGVSHGYLSQVINGKKSASQQILKALLRFGVDVRIVSGYQSGYQISNHNSANIGPQIVSKCARSSVDRASVFETGGRGFESLQAHHFLKLQLTQKQILTRFIRFWLLTTTRVFSQQVAGS
jgi:transcriptional regulator with XRE-family HTH domain